jgi:hypothetical protein
MRKRHGKTEYLQLSRLNTGGRGGIRTLEAELPPTRFPVARTRPGYATLP